MRVIPSVILERIQTPGGEMVLSQRGPDFSIRIGGTELMNSRNHGSEDELGRLTCGRLGDIAKPRVLIGGLGLGYTLRAALDALPAAAKVDLVEIVPDVVRWNRTVFGDLARRPLEDPRVTVIVDDVTRVISRQTTGLYHAIMLDVDNGPDGVFENNFVLYQRAGLATAHVALVPGGTIAVWSSFVSPTFTKWLQGTGFEVEVRTVKTHGARHTIWFGRRPERSR